MIKSSNLVCTIGLLWCFILQASSSSISLVSEDGVVKSRAIVDKFLQNNAIGTQPVKKVGIFDNIYSKIVNEVLGTDFDLKTKGLSLLAKDESTLLFRGCYDSMLDTVSCGAKICDYFHEIGCGHYIMIAKADSVEDILQAQEQIFRRVVSLATSSSTSSTSPLKFTFLLDLSADNSNNRQQAEEKISGRLQELYSDIALPSPTAPSLNAVLSVEVQLLSSSEEVEEGIDSDRLLSAGVSSASSVTADRLVAAWSALPATPRPVYSREDSANLYLLESTCLSTVSSTARFFSLLSQRVYQEHKLIPLFAQRVHRFLSTALKSVSSVATAGSGTTSLARERAQRLSLVRSSVLEEAVELARAQIALAEQRILDQLRRDLYRIYSKQLSLEEDENSASQVEALAQEALRKALFDHRALLKDVLDDSLGLRLSDAQSADLQAKCEKLVAGYASSPEMDLLKLRMAEKAVTKAPRQRSRRGGRGAVQRAKAAGKEGSSGGLLSRLLAMAKLSLSVVGMLRPGGLGNLQGVIGYSSSLFGAPLDLMLGVHNDGDSAEIVGEDREHPLLRLQPKMHLDIDVQ